jgi:hypothetical protein
MKAKIVISFIMMFSLMSCRFYVMYKDTAEPGYLCGKGDDQFVTVYEKDNKDYEIYVRYNQFDNIYFNNIRKKGKPDYDGAKYRTEIQYIIVNTKNNTIFYISTTPSRYIRSKDKNTYLMEGKVDRGNSYFFNSYFIGRMVNDTIMVFKNNKAKMIWKIKKTSSGLDVNTVISHKIRGDKDIHSFTRLVSEILGCDFRFVKFNNSASFTYIHQNDLEDSGKVKNAIEHIILNRIRYISCGNTVTKVLLNYNTTIDHNSQYKNIFYKKGRIRFINEIK